MRRLSCLAVLIAAAVLAASASAGAPDPSGAATGRALGMVPTWASAMATQWLNGAYRATYGSGKLYNHGGPVMTTNTTYAIYWNPSNYGQSLPAGYDTLINRYFTDVAADSGLRTNVYYTATQYSGIQYSSAFAGALSDTDALPGNGCSVYSGVSKCLTTAQLQSEVSSFVTAKGLPRGPSVQYFLFTPAGVGSCDGSSCAYTNYCAYHDWIGSGSSEIIWANQPWVENVSGCDAGHHPNSLPGDAVLNVVSHEHNEAITDPNGNAWYDNRGYENGDKCAWSWGSPTGSGSSAYNQVINGNHYMLQLEYSNADRGCVMSGL
ncbi:MAG TPA: hypothetical protein VGK79_02745 [Gaiellaceae bacterium]